MIQVTIRNPNTGKTETIGQEEFNRYMSMTNGEVLSWIVDEKPAAKSVTSILNKMGVPGPLEMARAFSRLEILPNPTPQDDQSGETEKHVESPWQNVPKPTIDPNAWDKAEIALVHFQDLKSTNTYCNRKNVKEHIESMGEAITRYRSFALVAEIDGQAVIIDGHHRLFAMWLLGYDNAPVWYIKVGE